MWCNRSIKQKYNNINRGMLIIFALDSTCNISVTIYIIRILYKSAHSSKISVETINISQVLNTDIPKYF